MCPSPKKKKYITIIVHLNVVLFDTGSPTFPLSKSNPDLWNANKASASSEAQSHQDLGHPTRWINGVITPRSYPCISSHLYRGPHNPIENWAPGPTLQDDMKHVLGPDGKCFKKSNPSGQFPALPSPTCDPIRQIHLIAPQKMFQMYQKSRGD